MTSWEDYIGASKAGAQSVRCRAMCGASFEPVRVILTRIIAALAPRSVACLGAGVLNDIPFRDLVRAGVDLHLVDWIPGVIETGIEQSIIERGAAGRPECAFCPLGEPRARTFCHRFDGARDGVCGSFDRADGASTCTAYERGDWPRVLRQDVTRGYASAFARDAIEATRTAATWRQALKRASAVARTAGRDGDTLDIADGAIELVTSSMVMSQFDHEPYDYFSHQLASRLGAPSAQDERRLAGPLAVLRSELVERQIAGHLDEVARIMAPGGRFFAAFEMFHGAEAGGGGFLVRPMHRALELLDDRFDFDFDLLPPGDSIIEMRISGEASVVQTFVLRHKHGHANGS